MKKISQGKRSTSNLLIVLVIAAMLVCGIPNAALASVSADVQKDVEGTMLSEYLPSDCVDELLEEEDLSFIQVQDLCGEIDEMEDACLPIEYIDRVNFDGKDFTYELDFGSGIVDEVSVAELDNGSCAYSITEGEKSDSLVVRANGDIYLDGKKVTWTEPIIDDEASECKSDLIQSYSSITKTKVDPLPALGKKWKEEYETNKTVRVPDVHVNKDLEDITISALVGTVVTVITKNPKTADLAVTMTKSAASSLIAYAVSKSLGSSKYVSFIVHVFNPVGGSRISKRGDTPVVYAEKCVTQYYPKKDCKGGASSKARVTRYLISEIG